MEEGYIKLFRNLLNWEWYSDINVHRLFTHCLLRANYEDTKWKGIEIKRGQFLTSYDHLSKETGLSVQNIRTCINKLKLTGELTYKSTSHYSIITVNNWDKWQAEQQTKRQATNKQLTTDKNNKEYKEEKNIYINVLNYLNQKANRNFKIVDTNLKYIKARLNNGFTKEELCLVVDTKVAEWKDNKDMSKYLRPSTLFGEKCDNYLQQANNKVIPINDDAQKDYEEYMKEYNKRFV